MQHFLFLLPTCSELAAHTPHPLHTHTHTHTHTHLITQSGKQNSPLHAHPLKPGVPQQNTSLNTSSQDGKVSGNRVPVWHISHCVNRAPAVCLHRIGKYYNTKYIAHVICEFTFGFIKQSAFISTQTTYKHQEQSIIRSWTGERKNG